MSHAPDEKDRSSLASSSPQSGRKAASTNTAMATAKIHRGGGIATVGRAIDNYRAKQIVPASMLFEVGVYKDAADDESYLRRLNTALALRTFQAQGRYPADLAQAIDKKGRANPHAEILIFGRWLLIEGMPGAKPTPGPRPDPKIVLQTLTTAVSILRRQEQGRSLRPAKSGSQDLRITKTRLAKEWTRLFGDALPASAFDTRVRTLKRVLGDFERRVKSGALRTAGQVVRDMPQITRVAGAMGVGTLTPASIPTSGSSSPPVAAAGAFPAGAVTSTPAATPVPRSVPGKFEVELRYSSANHERDYRGCAPGTLPVTKIGYVVEPMTASSEGRRLRKGREGRLVLRPEVNLRKDYRLRALIDRMAILVSTRTKTDRTTLHQLIKRQTGTLSYVVDRTLIGRLTTGWEAQLPKPDASCDTGYHFAIMIQEPEARSLAKLLSAIDGAYGIDGPVEPVLNELSIDFRPTKSAAADEQIRLREQMVGLLQRHHWAPHSVLTSAAEDLTGAIDGRQVYLDEKDRLKTRYLFSRRTGTLHLSDAALDRPEVRERILQTKAGSDLVLNATVYKGAGSEGLTLSIQHKIKDRRNPETGSSVDLDAHERRARIEVCLAGRDRLTSQGLGNVNDLSRLSFRQLRKNLLMFRLGTAAPEHVESAVDQMGRRGVYGLELVSRMRERKKKEQERRRRQSSRSIFEDEGTGLVDWREMNDAVGQALDLLAKRWHRFRWL